MTTLRIVSNFDIRYSNFPAVGGVRRVMAAAGFKCTEITKITTLGETFRQFRQQKEASITDAELATSVASKFLVALEKGRYLELPADVYAAGFVRRYANWLGLDAKLAISQYRSERKLAENAKAPQKQMEKINLRPIRNFISPRLWITPERFIGLAVAGLILVFISYVWFQVKSFAAAPPLNVATAFDNEVVHVDTLTLAGSTAADAKLEINGELIPVNDEGKFSATIRLVDGVNMIELKAQSRTDKETVRVLKVLAALDESKNDQGVELPIE